MIPPLLEARHVGRRHPAGKGAASNQNQETSPIDPRDWLLEDVSIAIHSGNWLALAGPSGGGKTLLLRALAALDPIDRGEIRWQGKPVPHDEIPRFRRQAIYLHQRPAFREETVEAALKRPFALHIHRERAFDRPKVVRKLELLGRNESFLELPVRNLSGGERQIAALLRAIQLDPTVLLLDEPLAAMDPKTTEAAEQLLSSWLTESARARAILCVSHDAEQSNRVADTTYLMQAGRLTTPSQVEKGTGTSP